MTENMWSNNTNNSGPANKRAGNPDTGSFRTTALGAHTFLNYADRKAFGKNSLSTQALNKKAGESTNLIHVIPAQVFEDAIRYGQINIFQLDYTYFHPPSSSYVIAIPVYRDGYINSIDRRCYDPYF
ncbi:hypothetical protein DPMN_051069 [Dreissena polymorpha]|uniref:Uncharacterized protein n=1 Tax=Dreissena polymorpha TaxID=45954 RepID=A0A9D4CIF0_DREPO|nr:hypothetical protein DPMN_051069 [Dreissena polymorpha]